MPIYEPFKATGLIGPGTNVTFTGTGTKADPYVVSATAAGGGGGTVTSVTSADGNATVATSTTTPVITVVSAPKLTTARNINGVPFDGTASITITDPTKAPLGGYIKASTDTEVGTLNWVQDSATGYLTHFTTGANSGPNNAAMAIGTDAGSATGLLISHKNSGRGLEIGAQPGSGTALQIQGRTSNFPMRVQLFPGAGFVSYRATSGAGYSDGVATNGSTTFTSATATFVAGDVGKTITQLTSRGSSDPFGCIPIGATITAVGSTTSVTMSAPSTASGTGVLFEVGSRVVPDSQVLMGIQDENSATLTTVSKDGIIARGAAVGSVPLRVNQRSGQTAPIFAVYDSFSNLLSYVGAKGHLMTSVKTAPVSGDLNNSRVGLWLDDTAGAPKMKFTAKDSAGTLFTGGISIDGNDTPSKTYVDTADATKQATLVSGTNIKTINGTTLLGSGDVSTVQTTITGNAGTATTLATGRTIGTLTGDVTSAGSSFNGSANNTNATTLATVNSNVGSFGSASSVNVQTVNAKGLTTAASSVAIQIAQSQVTNLTTDLAAKQAASVIAANGMGVCVHGATASTARPTGFAQITWIGSVAPTNAATNDIWYQ